MISDPAMDPSNRLTSLACMVQLTWWINQEIREEVRWKVAQLEIFRTALTDHVEEAIFERIIWGTNTK